jgi:hypothetical protein
VLWEKEPRGGRADIDIEQRIGDDHAVDSRNPQNNKGLQSR